MKNILEKIKLAAIVCIDCVSENRHVTAWAILRYWFFTAWYSEKLKKKLNKEILLKIYIQTAKLMNFIFIMICIFYSSQDLKFYYGKEGILRMNFAWFVTNFTTGKKEFFDFKKKKKKKNLNRIKQKCAFTTKGFAWNHDNNLLICGPLQKENFLPFYSGSIFKRCLLSRNTNKKSQKLS